MNTCISCKFIERDDQFAPKTPATCLHPEMERRTLNFVTGIDVVEHALCDAARGGGACKPEALFWEASDTVPAVNTKDDPNGAVIQDFQQQVMDRLYRPQK